MKAKYLLVAILITIVFILISLTFNQGLQLKQNEEKKSLEARIFDLETKMTSLEKKINVLEGRIYNLENPKLKMIPVQ